MKARVLIQQLGRYEGYVAGAIMGVATASIWLQLGSRLIRGRALPWPEELTVILLIYLSSFAAAALFKAGQLIEVDYFFHKLLPFGLKAPWMKVVWAICLFTFAVLLGSALTGLPVAMSFTAGAAIAIPRGVLRFPLIYMCITNIAASLVFLLTPVPREAIMTETDRIDEMGCIVEED